jgi:DNA-binding NarL/FixJ family response regulator
MMPDTNAIELLAMIRAQYADVPVLVLTAMSEVEYAAGMIKAGANGFINKQYAVEELIDAVQAVLAGDTYLSKEAVAALANEFRADKAEKPHDALSSRELEVLVLIARGHAVKKIAFELSISTKTVATYVSRIREKIGLSNYVDIARYAMKHNLVD